MFRLIILVLSVVGCSCTPRMIGNPGYDSLRQEAIDKAWKTFDSCLAKLTIEILDDISQTPVSARIVIHPLKGVSFAELQEQSLQPLQQDTQLINFFTDYMEQYRKKYVGGSQETIFETNGSLDLLVNHNGKYVIETFHPDYQYTNNILIIKFRHQKTNLRLKEKGIIVRIDFQDE
jgi:hypothetical protein